MEITSVFVTTYFASSPGLLRCESVDGQTAEIFIDAEAFACLGFRLTRDDLNHRALILAGLLGRSISDLAHGRPVEDIRARPSYLPKRLGSPPRDFALSLSVIARSGPYPAFWSTLAPADPSAPYPDLSAGVGSPGEPAPRSRLPHLNLVVNAASRNQWAGRHVRGDTRGTRETLAILIERRLMHHKMLLPDDYTKYTSTS